MAAPPRLRAIEQFRSAAGVIGVPPVTVGAAPPVGPADDTDPPLPPTEEEMQHAVRVLCTLPNTSALVNGWKFASVPDGMLSEAMPLRVAVGFAAIAGYSIVQPPPAETVVSNPASPGKVKDDGSSTGPV